MDFARNPAGADVVPDWLATFGAARMAPRWLLVDAALLDGKRFLALASSLSWSVSNAMKGSALEAFGAEAPHLVALPNDSGDAEKGLTRFLAIAPTSPAFSLLESSSSVADLTRLFGYLAQARIDGDLPLHCRFADSRVLPQLLHNLSPAQRSRVAADVSAWAWLDNLGAVQAWRRAAGNEPASSIDRASSLELDKLQFAAMLDASEPDTMFSLLIDNTPELVPSQGRGEFRDRLSKILGRASARHLVTPNDRLQFAILSLSCGDAFHEHADLQPTWFAIEEQDSTLVEQMKQWSDEFWARLQNREAVR